MNNIPKASPLTVLLLTFVLSGCASDQGQPKTLQQQQAMARGHAPTKEQLDKAMSQFKQPDQAPQHP